MQHGLCSNASSGNAASASTTSVGLATTGHVLQENGLDYKPQPGDVVEFEYNGKRHKGLIYSGTGYEEVAVIHKEIGKDARYFWCRASYGAYTGMLKIRHTDTVPSNALDFDEAEEIAKAYFSHPFKVGDRVKIARKPKENEPNYGWVGPMDRNIGFFGRIILKEDSRSRVEVNGSKWWYKDCNLEHA
jgi:hypothetical protein